MDVDATLKAVSDSFYADYNKNKKLSRLYQKVRDGTATYKQANDFAIEVGNILVKSYKSNLETESMDFATALKLLNNPMNNNYKLISEYCDSVQSILNGKYRMQVNSVIPNVNQDRINGLAKAVSTAKTEIEAVNLFGEPIINFSQSVVDDVVRENARFASDLGFTPQIVREYEGPHNERGRIVDCKYCQGLAGTYDYADVKSGNSEVYKRHEGCRCTLTYIPSKGTSTRMRTSGNAFVRG